MDEDEKEMVPVKVIGARGGSALVETGDYRRAYVPVETVIDSTVDPAILERGVPYGVAWEKYITITATPESIAADLRRHGIYCLLDLKKPVLDQVSRAFDLGEFIRLVHKEEK